MDFQDIFRLNSQQANEEVHKYVLLLNEMFNLIMRSSNSIKFEYHISGLQNFIPREDFSIYKSLVQRSLDQETKESIYLRLSLAKMYNSNLKEYLDKSFKCLPALVTPY